MTCLHDSTWQVNGSCQSTWGNQDMHKGERQSMGKHKSVSGCAHLEVAVKVAAHICDVSKIACSSDCGTEFGRDSRTGKIQPPDGFIQQDMHWRNNAHNCP